MSSPGSIDVSALQLVEVRHRIWARVGPVRARHLAKREANKGGVVGMWFWGSGMVWWGCLSLCSE
jgi:hypothetical protein